jgi:UPF0755 protein
MQRRPKQRYVILAIVLTAGLSLLVLQGLILQQLNAAKADDGRPVEFLIEPDESVGSIANRLNAAGLIRSATYFRFRAQFTGQDNEIVAGVHQLDTGMTTSQILDVITSEDRVAAQEITVQFIEGWRTEQFAEALVAAGLPFTTEEFMTETSQLRWSDTFPFLRARPSGVGLEGYLFPNTYNFEEDATPDEVILILLQTFAEQVTPAIRDQARQLGLTFHQAITLASIIERESALPEERPLVASVYYNRFLTGMPLQADPTVQYELGTPEAWWPVLTADDTQETGRYNTYRNPGLPPGPICNPSLDAIEAALNPAQTDYLFFVATGDGSHAFATTFEEHQQNILRYQTTPTP